MSVAALLEHVVDGYLLGDLKSMRTAIRPAATGAVCYPMLMAVLAGSELLGSLTGDTGDPIERYWQTYMSRVNDRYGDIAAIASELCRNGVAHMYLTKPGVGVVRAQPARHLVREHSDLLILDCDVLHDHFKQSYERHARADIQRSDEEAQRRLNKLVRHYATKSAQLLNKLPADRFPIPQSVPSHTRRPTASGIESIRPREERASRIGSEPRFGFGWLSWCTRERDLGRAAERRLDEGRFVRTRCVVGVALRRRDVACSHLRSHHALGRPSGTAPETRHPPRLRGFLRCRRRDSNPRHADYDREHCLREARVYGEFRPFTRRCWGS